MNISSSPNKVQDLSKSPLDKYNASASGTQALRLPCLYAFDFHCLFLFDSSSKGYLVLALLSSQTWARYAPNIKSGLFPFHKKHLFWISGGTLSFRERQTETLPRRSAGVPVPNEALTESPDYWRARPDHFPACAWVGCLQASPPSENACLFYDLWP